MNNEPVVFVVDDDPAARDLVAVLAKSHGMAVESYASAEQFLGHFDRSRHGCLVVDAQIPGVGGLELQKQLRAEEIDLPVIVTCARAEIPTAVRAMQGGAVTVLEKPYCRYELWENICMALQQHRKHREHQIRRAKFQESLAAAVRLDLAEMEGAEGVA